MRFVFILIVLLIANGINVKGQTDPNFESVLNAYIKEQGIALEDTNLRMILAEWPGNRTMDGVRSIVEELLKPTGGNRRSTTSEILKYSGVPRQQIVSYILERAEASRRDIEQFLLYFQFFDRYPEDDRILKFLAPLLDNKTVPKSSYRKPGERDESSGYAPWRICDFAHGTIIRILIDRGEMKNGDPSIGDPGGEGNVKGREVNIANLKSLLIKSGYMVAAEPQPSPIVAVTPKALPLDQVTVEESSAHSPTAVNSGVASTPNHRNWPLWLGLAIVLVGMAFAVFKGRAGK